MAKKSTKTFGQKLHDFFSIDINGGSFRNVLFENLATMLAADIDISSILTGLEKEARTANAKQILKEMQVEIHNGTPIWKVMQRHKLVADHHLSLIRVGEESGNLPANLQNVIVQLNREKEFSSKMKSASIYPGMIFVLLIVVTTFVFTFVIPKLSKVYEGLKVELPTITKAMMSIGNYLEKNGVVVVPLFFLFLGLVIHFIFFNKKTKHIGQFVMLRTPAIGRLIQEGELSKLGFLGHNLLVAGLPIVSVFQLLANATQNREYSTLYTTIAVYLQKGLTLREIFQTYPKIGRYFPVYPLELLMNGERTGKIPENLQKIGEIFEKKNDATLKDINVIFEPVMLLIVWVGVAFFALSVILPLYSVLGSINEQPNNQIPTSQPVSSTNENK